MAVIPADLPTRAAPTDRAAPFAPWFQRYLNRLSRRQRAEPLWPFDHHCAVSQGVLQAELERFFGTVQPVKIEMGEQTFGALVGLHQGVGRAGGFLVGPGPGAHHAASQGGLAGAQRSPQQQGVSRL